MTYAEGGRYPVMVDLEDRPCLVVGGGEVATRKVPGLLAADARVTVFAPSLTAPLAELASDNRIQWVSATYTSLPTLPGNDRWAFVIAATDDPALNHAIAQQGTSAGVWVNDASDPRGGPASVPAVRREGAVTVAVSTGGIHPSAARWLCDRAAAAVSPEVLVALEMVEEVRLHDVASGGDGRRPDWRLAVDSGMLDLIRAGHLAEAKERLQACLSSSSD